MSTIRLQRSLAFIVAMALSASACNAAASPSPSQTGAPTSSAAGSGAACAVPTVDVSIPPVTIKFSNAEFLDDTPAILGTTQNWFSAVGITLDPAPAGAVHTPADHAALLLNGTEEIMTSNYAVLLPALANTSNLRTFAYADFFLGWAVMGKKDFKTYQEFVQGGMSPRTPSRPRSLR